MAASFFTIPDYDGEEVIVASETDDFGDGEVHIQVFYPYEEP